MSVLLLQTRHLAIKIQVPEFLKGLISSLTLVYFDEFILNFFWILLLAIFEVLSVTLYPAIYIVYIFFCLIRVKFIIEEIEREEAALREDLYSADRKFAEYYNVCNKQFIFSPCSFCLSQNLVCLICGFEQSLICLTILCQLGLGADIGCTY